MSRLTAKKEDRYFEIEEFWVSAEEPSEDEIDNVYFKLAEIEDLLDKYYISSVNQLDKMLEDYMLPDEEMLASKLLKKEERKKVCDQLKDYITRRYLASIKGNGDIFLELNLTDLNTIFEIIEDGKYENFIPN